jgi:ABC-type polysaccharide/polyol phosphate export permease
LLRQLNNWPFQGGYELNLSTFKQGTAGPTAVGANGNGNLRLLVTTASEDLVHGLRRYDLWGRIAFMEIKRRYRRTVIGPFWSTISLAILIAIMGTVGTGLWKQHPSEYIPFLASGMMVWLMISTMITESCSLFINSQHLFSRIRMDYSILAYALMWRNLLGFFHNLAIYLLVVVIFVPGLFNISILWIFPGLLVIALNSVWVALLLGTACVRFRDVQQLIITILQISLFITPVFWPPQLLTGMTKYLFVDFNPLYSFIDVIRAPLLGKSPMFSSYAIILAVTVLGWLATFHLFSRFRKRIAFWV